MVSRIISKILSLNLKLQNIPIGTNSTSTKYTTLLGANITLNHPLSYQEVMKFNADINTLKYGEDGESKYCFKELMKKYPDSFPIISECIEDKKIKFVYRSGIKVNDRTYNAAGFLERLYGECKTDEEKEFLIVCLALKSKHEDFVDEIIDYLKEKQEEAGPEEIPETYKGLRPFLDPGSRTNGFITDNIYLVDEQDRIVTRLDGATFVNVVKLKDFSILPHRLRKYLPYGPQVFMETFMDREVECNNTYVAPKWRWDWTPHYDKKRAKAELPPEIGILFKQIAIEAEDRKYLYFWVYESLVGRARTHLTLSGSPGSGKTTFKELFTALHGKDNKADGRKNSLIGKFNNQLFNTSAVITDEWRGEPDDENRMKELLNRQIAIEIKNKSTTSNNDITASFLYINNEDRDNYIHFESRKFSFTNVSSKRLETVISKETLDKLTEIFADDTFEKQSTIDYIRRVADYIFAYGKELFDTNYFPQGEYRGSKFWHLCHTSMFVWQRLLVESILKPSVMGHIGKQIPYLINESAQGLKYSELFALISRWREEKRDMKVFPQDYTRPMNFLRSYRDKSGNQVFKVSLIPDDSLGDFKIEFLKLEDLL